MTFSSKYAVKRVFVRPTFGVNIDLNIHHFGPCWIRFDPKNLNNQKCRTNQMYICKSYYLHEKTGTLEIIDLECIIVAMESGRSTNQPSPFHRVCYRLMSWASNKNLLYMSYTINHHAVKNEQIADKLLIRSYWLNHESWTKTNHMSYRTGRFHPNTVYSENIWKDYVWWDIFVCGVM